MTGLSVRPEITPQERLEQYADRLDALELALKAIVAKLEMSDRAVTVLHEDTLRLQRLIRTRAGDLAARYGLGKAAEGEIRKAIKRDLLSQWRVRDLHDLPKRDLDAVGIYIGSYSSFALVKKVREKYGQAAQ